MLFLILFEVFLSILGLNDTNYVYEIRGTLDILNPVRGTIPYIHRSHLI